MNYNDISKWIKWECNNEEYGVDFGFPHRRRLCNVDGLSDNTFFCFSECPTKKFGMCKEGMINIFIPSFLYLTLFETTTIIKSERFLQETSIVFLPTEHLIDHLDNPINSIGLVCYENYRGRVDLPPLGLSLSATPPPITLEESDIENLLLTQYKMFYDIMVDGTFESKGLNEELLAMYAVFLLHSRQDSSDRAYVLWLRSLFSQIYGEICSRNNPGMGTSLGGVGDSEDLEIVYSTYANVVRLTHMARALYDFLEYFDDIQIFYKILAKKERHNPLLQIIYKKLFIIKDRDTRAKHVHDIFPHWKTELENLIGYFAFRWEHHGSFAGNEKLEAFYNDKCEIMYNLITKNNGIKFNTISSPPNPPRMI